MRIISTIIVIGFVHIFNVSAQENGYLIPKVVEVKNIPQSQIQNVFEDKNKLIWFTYGREIFRYDGTQVENLKHFVNRYSLKLSLKKMLVKNDKKLILAEMSSCISEFNADTKTIKDYLCYPSEEILDFTASQKDKFYVLTKKGNKHLVHVINETNNKIYKTINSLYQSNNAKIFANDGFLYYLTSDKIQVYDAFSNLVDEYTFQDNALPEKYKNQLSIGKCKSQILISHPLLTGINQLELVNNKLEINQIYNKANRKVGLLEFDDQSNALAAWKDKDGFIDSLTRFSKYNACIPEEILLEDKTMLSIGGQNFMEQIVIGGYFGLKFLKFPLKSFTPILSKSLTEVKTVQDGFNMRGIVKIDDDIYFAKENESIFRYNTKNENIDTLNLRDSSDHKITLQAVTDLLYNASSGKIFVSSCDRSDLNFLYEIDPNTGICNKIMSPSRITSMDFLEKDSKIICAFESDTLDYATFKIQNHSFEKMNKKNFAVNTFVRVYEGLIFLGGKNGLNVLDKYRQTPRKYLTLERMIGNDEIYHISKLNNKIFIGTAHNGLYVFDIITYQTIKLNTENGLKSNAVTSVLTDETDHKWVATYNGLHYMDADFNTLHVYTSLDGINHNEFNRYSYFNDGEYLFFGSINGILKIDIQQFNQLLNKNAQSLYLQKIVYFDKKSKTSKSDFFDGFPSDISFNEDAEEMKLSFGSRNHLEQSAIRAKIIGKDVNWRNQDEQGFLPVDDLKSGEYNLEIQRKNDAGIWISYPTDLHITREEYFYKTAVFLISLVCTSSVCCILFIFLWYKKRNKSRLYHKKIVSELHEHLDSSLSSISLKAQLMDSSSGNRDFDSIANEAQAALQHIRDTIWSLNPKNDNVETLIERCKEYSASLFHNPEIEIKFNLDLDLKKKLKVSTRRELYFIFKEALGNVLKQSDPSYVKVNITHKNGMFELMVTNDGIKPDYIEKENMTSRIKNIGGMINFENVGSHFTQHVITPAM